MECNEKSVILFVRDYGRVFSAEKLVVINRTGGDIGVGISGMRERLNELDGSLDIQSDDRVRS